MELADIHMRRVISELYAVYTTATRAYVERLDLMTERAALLAELLAEAKKQPARPLGAMCVICTETPCEWGYLHDKEVHLSLCSTCAPKAPAATCVVCRKDSQLVKVFLSGRPPEPLITLL
jgi:hypothetical protein